MPGSVLQPFDCQQNQSSHLFYDALETASVMGASFGLSTALSTLGHSYVRSSVLGAIGGAVPGLLWSYSHCDSKLKSQSLMVDLAQIGASIAVAGCVSYLSAEFLLLESTTFLMGMGLSFLVDGGMEIARQKCIYGTSNEDALLSGLIAGSAGATIGLAVRGLVTRFGPRNGDLFADVMERSSPKTSLLKNYLGHSLYTQDGTEIKYPFRDPQTFRIETQQSPQERAEVLYATTLFRRYVHKALGRCLNTDGRNHVWEGQGGVALKFYNNFVHAERLHVMQGLLRVRNIPYLPLAQDKAALALAEQGVLVQKLLPTGAKSVDDICQLYGDITVWEELQKVIERHCGDGAWIQYLEIRRKISTINNDTVLLRQVYRRGYSTVNIKSFSLSVVDFLGGHGWGSNLYWHKDHGWFLVDW